jgi:hypothetical protein
LRPLIHSAGVWNHLAASISRSRLPMTGLPCARGERYAGQSKMNFHSLLLHGLGAMSVYVDMILVRIITYISLFVMCLLVAITAVIIIRFATGLAIPGWATTVSGVLMILLLQSFIFVFTSVFMLLNMRSMNTFIPTKDGLQYIDSQKHLKLNTSIGV